MEKDLFSNQADKYARYRPGYPSDLIDYILQFVKEKNSAWDCACGNGQAAVLLSAHFKKIDATDISEAQIKNAVQRNNISYQVCSAEDTPFPDNSFDLITVAQAYHWLNWKRFREEAIRVGKNQAIVAIWGYGLLSTSNEKLDNLIRHFYTEIVGPYWDAERKHIDTAYQTVDFDFQPLPSREFFIALHWTKEDLFGYFESWSAVQHYIETNQVSPIEKISGELGLIWNDIETRPVQFPVFLKLGRVIK
jgi:ubiquinone/menaquinone biosynthesis C-methylase UbiE